LPTSRARSRWPACNPETGYLNVDGSPTKTLILEARRANPADPFWALCFGRRAPVEFYNLMTDRDCVDNLANTTASVGISVSQLAPNGGVEMYKLTPLFSM
jgi:hypothetical protein